MKTSPIVLLFATLLYVEAVAQVKLTAIGLYPTGSEALAGAGVYVNGEGQGITNIEGQFVLTGLQSRDSVHVNFTGFESGGLLYQGEPTIRIELNPLTIDEVDVVESREGMTIKSASLGLEMEMNQKELRRAACCNLSESFENNPSIDVSFADAITGTRTIEMLGLSGQYLSTHIELMPYLRGIQTRRGWAYIPGPWLQSLQLSKGIGSVSVGHETMTGQLNLELRKPFGDPGNHLNLYANAMGRVELNYTTAYPVNEVWSSSTSIHADRIFLEVDRNNDNFMDGPQGHLLSFIHRWKASFKKGWESQIGIRVVDDLQIGGHLSSFAEDESDLWRYERKSQGISVFSKVGRVFPDNPSNSMGMIAEFHYQDLENPFGQRSLSAEQTGAHIQLIFDHDDPLQKWAIKSGVNGTYDLYDKSLVDFTSTYSGVQEELDLGAFSEVSIRPNDKFSALLGARVDVHNLFGTRVSPRAHLKYIIKEGSILRMSSGLGFRSAHPWLEYSELMASNRLFNPGGAVPFFEQRLRAESAWNSGISWQKDFRLNYRKGTLVLDYFYTQFQNRLVVDRYRSANAYWFTDLNGQSQSHSFMAQLDYEVKRRMSIRAAYKFTWSETDYFTGSFLDPFVSVHRGFIAWFYETRNQWGFDVSAQFHGPKKLPRSPDPDVLANSTFYSLVNVQVKKSWKDGKYEVFAGSENLLDFRQDQPIYNAENALDPSSSFDGTVVWAPIMGRVLFIGGNIKF